MTAYQGSPSARQLSFWKPLLVWQRAYVAAILAVILLVVNIELNHWTFSSIQAVGIANESLPLALAAIGETFVVLTNGIDLSTGSIVTLANVTTAVLAGHGLAPLGVLVALGLGAAAGLLNGLIVCYAQIAPLIATLATGSIYVGVALVILPYPGGATIPAWLTSWTVGTISVIPVSAIWLTLAALAGWFFLRRSKFGVDLQAIGGSEASSWSAGIRVVRVRILAYVASGVCCALAGVVLAGLTTSGDPTIGAVYLLNAVAALVVGGTSLSGGVGTLVGSLLGAIVLSLVASVLFAANFSTNLQFIVTGVIVIGALLAQSAQSKRSARTSQRRQRSSNTLGEQPASL